MGCLLERSKTGQFSLIKIPIFLVVRSKTSEFFFPSVVKKGAVGVVLLTHFFS